MYLLRFPNHPGCHLYIEVGIEKAGNFLAVCDEIASLFDMYMPARDEMPLRVSIVRAEGSPCCYRGSHEIYLNTEIRYVSQAAYQFAHEMCHYRIPYLVAENLRWLEESICETASHFYMRRLAHVYAERDGHVLLKAYAPQFAEYSDKVLKESRDVDLADPLQIRRMELNWYLREENRCVAAKLLPLFEQRPALWQAVPFLGDIPPGFSLSDSFSIWKKTAPAVSRRALGEMQSLFM
ncbi:MAG: hypothetical protein Q4A32_07735 [Lachnospiraceae bacterium]|nr:hypothetical protein [Lachnospiraceae bacterium]